MENQKQNSRPGYEYLVAYQLGKVIQDLTVEFCDQFIDKKSRTHDQMVQAARSNPQNVAEGYTAESLKKKHEEEGGLTENLYRKRIAFRDTTPPAAPSGLSVM